MKNLVVTIAAFVLLAGISSCGKKDVIPTGGVDPSITVNFSLDSLKARYNGNPYQITQSLVISAVVVADDSSGTFYKSLAIEDSTSGIMLMIDGSSLYEKYPMGTRLFVQLQGLYVVQVKGVFELVAILNADGSFTGIPVNVENQFITTGKWGIYVAPKVLTIPQLNAAPNRYQSELIQLNNVQFQTGATNVPYVSNNINLRDCGGENVIQVYTSSYSDFANNLTPAGNGTFVCIYSVYNGSPELLVRDTADITMTGALCP